MNIFTFILVLLVSTIGYLATDIYLPSLPTITDEFKISNNLVQFSISIYLFGLASSQIFYGSFSDKHGRRKAIIFSLLTSMIGTLVCIFAIDIYWLNIGRLIQGIGMGGVISVSRAIIPDLFKGTAMAKYDSYIMMSMSLILAFAPVLGGYIQLYSSWRGVFVFVLLYSMLIVILTTAKLPETNQHLYPDSLKLKTIIKNITQLINNKNFMGACLCTASTLAGILAYITISPFLLQRIVGLSYIEFAWFTLIIDITFVFGALLNSYLVERYNLKTLLGCGVILMLISGFILLYYHYQNYIGVISIALPTVLYFFATCMILANAGSIAITPLPKNIIGIAGALIETIQILGESVSTAIIAILPEDNQLPLALAYILSGCIATVTFTLIKKPIND